MAYLFCVFIEASTRIEKSNSTGSHDKEDEEMHDSGDVIATGSKTSRFEKMKREYIEDNKKNKFVDSESSSSSED